MDEKTPIQQLYSDLIKRYQPEREKELTIDRLKQVEAAYGDDYKLLITEYLQKNKPEKVSKLTDSFFAQVETTYGLKKKESTKQELPTVEGSQLGIETATEEPKEELTPTEKKIPSTYDWRKALSQQPIPSQEYRSVDTEGLKEDALSTKEFTDFSNLKNDLHIVAPPKDEKELLDAEMSTGNKQKNDKGQSISDEILLRNPLLAGEVVLPYVERALGGAGVELGEFFKTTLSIMKLPDEVGMKVARWVYGDDMVNKAMMNANLASNKLGIGDAYDIKDKSHAIPTDARDKLVKWATGESEELNQLGKDTGADNMIGNVVEGSAKAAVMIAGTSSSPEVLLPRLARFGIKKLAQFPVYMGVKQMMSAEEGIPGWKGVKEFAKGWGTGTAYELMGLGAGKLGGLVGSAIKNQAIKSGASEIEGIQKAIIPETITRILANSAMFGGYTAAEQLLTTGEVNAKDIEEAVGVSFVLSGRDIHQSIKNVNEVVRKGIEQKKTATLMTASYEQLASLNQIPVDISNLRQESIRLGQEIASEPNGSKSLENTLKKGVIDNMINLNAKVNEVVMFSDEHIKAVQDDPSLNAVEKKYAIDKINKVLDTNDPIRLSAEELIRTKEPIKAEIEAINESDKSDDYKKSFIQAKEKQLADIDKKVNSILTEPKYFVGEKEVYSADEVINEVRNEIEQKGNIPRVKVSNDNEGKNKVVEEVEKIFAERNKQVEEVKVGATEEKQAQSGIKEDKTAEIIPEEVQIENLNKQREEELSKEIGAVRYQKEQETGGRLEWQRNHAKEFNSDVRKGLEFSLETQRSLLKEAQDKGDAEMVKIKIEDTSKAEQDLKKYDEITAKYDAEISKLKTVQPKNDGVTDGVNKGVNEGIKAEEVQVAENKDLITAKDETKTETIEKVKGSILNKDKDLLGNEKVDEVMFPVEYEERRKIGENVGFINSSGENMKGNFRGTTFEGDKEVAIIDRPESKDGKKYNVTFRVPIEKVTFQKYEKYEVNKGVSDAIKYAIDNNVYQEYIKEGRMSANDAKTIIESAGLEVPKDILELAQGETKVTEPIVSEQDTTDIKQKGTEEFPSAPDVSNKEKEITGDNKPTKEKELAFSAEMDDISASFDVPDMSKEKQKEASDKLVAFVKENASRLREVSPTLTQHLVTEAAKVTPSNVKNKIKYIKKVIENSEFAKKVEEAEIERKKLDVNKIKDAAGSFKQIKDAVFRARLTNKGKKVTTWLNKMDLSKLDEDSGIIDDYVELLKGLNRKGVPDFTKLKPFIDKYKEVIQNTLDERMVTDLEKDNSEQAIMNKVKSVNETITRINSGVDLTPQDFIQAKREAGALQNRINSLVNNGLMSVEQGDLIANSPEYQALESFVNAEIPNIPKYKEQIRVAEENYKIKTLGEVSQLAIDNKGNGFTQQDNDLIDNIARNALKVGKDKVSLEAITPYQVEYLKLALEQIKETGIVPTGVYKLAEKLNTAKFYGETKADVFDALSNTYSNDNFVRDLLSKTQEGIGRALTAPAWRVGEILHLGERMGKIMRNKLYTTIASPSWEQINLSNRYISRAMEEVNTALSDLQKSESTAAGRAASKVFGVTGRNKAARVSSAKVGILMSNLRFYHLIESGNNVVKNKEDYNVINLDGKPVVDDTGVTINFKSASEAKQWIKDNKTKLIGEDNLDFFNLVNYGGHKIKRETAKFGGMDAIKNEELAIFDEAYNAISKGNKIVITNDAEALAYLNPKEQAYYKAVRKGLQAQQDRASAIAAREGKTLNTEEFYYPMLSRTNINNSIDTQNFVEQNIFGKDYKEGKLPQVAGYINPKSKMINYIDFDSYRVFDRYINDIMVSDFILPTARTQIEALDKLVKKYAGDEKTDAEAKALAKFARNVKDDIAIGYQTQYHQSKLGGDIKVPVGQRNYIDVGKGIRDLIGYSRNIMMQTGYRIPLDAIPNSMNLLINPLKAVGVKSSKEKLQWKSFFSQNEETLPAQKIEEFTVKASLGYQEGKPVEKGLLKELADRNITYGDAATSIEGWINNFKKGFKELYGQEFDLDRYHNEQSYRDQLQYDERFIEAKRLAHMVVTRTITPQSSFEGKRFLGKAFYGREPFKRGNWAFNWAAPLTLYSQNQSARFWQNIHNAYYNTNEGRGAAVKDMGLQFSGEMAYAMMAQGGLVFAKYIASTLHDDDDKKAFYEEQIGKLYKDPRSYMTSLLGSAATLAIGGYGNLGRLLIGSAYAVIGDGIADSMDKPTRARWMQTKKEIDTYASRFLNTKLNITKEYGKFSDFASLALPVTGVAGSRILQEANSLIQEGTNAYGDLTGDVDSKDFNAGNFLNSLNYLTATRWMTPISRDIDTYTKELGRVYGTYMRTEDAAYAAFLYGDYKLLHEEANQIRTKVENDKYGGGEEVFNKYLDKGNGEYRKRYDFYNVNKSSIDAIDSNLKAIEKSSGLDRKQKEELWIKLREYAEDMNNKYSEIEDKETVETGDLMWIPSSESIQKLVDIKMTVLNAAMKGMQEKIKGGVKLESNKEYLELKALLEINKPKEE